VKRALALLLFFSPTLALADGARAKLDGRAPAKVVAAASLYLDSKEAPPSSKERAPHLALKK
jgi:hypothetical protein